MEKNIPFWIIMIDDFRYIIILLYLSYWLKNLIYFE